MYNTSILLRKAGIADIPVLATLRIRFLQEVHPQPNHQADALLYQNLIDYFEKHIPDGSFVNWVATEAEQIVGTAGIVFYEQPPLFENISGKVGYILNVYTLPSHRRRGIARQLFEKIVQEGKQRQAGKLSLHASDDGRYLYEQFGFTAGGNEMNFTVNG